MVCLCGWKIIISNNTEHGCWLWFVLRSCAVPSVGRGDYYWYHDYLWLRGWVQHTYVVPSVLLQREKVSGIATIYAWYNSWVGYSHLLSTIQLSWASQPWFFVRFCTRRVTPHTTQPQQQCISILVNDQITTHTTETERLVYLLGFSATSCDCRGLLVSRKWVYILLLTSSRERKSVWKPNHPSSSRMESSVVAVSSCEQVLSTPPAMHVQCCMISTAHHEYTTSKNIYAVCSVGYPHRTIPGVYTLKMT